MKEWFDVRFEHQLHDHQRNAGRNARRSSPAYNLFFGGARVELVVESNGQMSTPARKKRPIKFSNRLRTRTNQRF